MVLNLTIGEVIAPFTRHRSIPPEKVRAFRERRGWTLEQMADEVWASPLEVAAWEAGTVRVPGEQATRMRTIAAQTPPARVPVPPSGPPALPRCAWAEAHVPGLYEILWHEPREVASNVQVQRHVAECPACQRVVHRDRTVPPPAPTSKRVRAKEYPADDLGPDMNAWEIFVLLVLIAVYGAVLTGVMVAGQGILRELTVPVPDLMMETTIGFMAFVVAGLFAGSGLPGRPYAAGLLAGLAGGVAALLTWKLQTPGADLADPLALAVCGGMALCAGLFHGWRLDGAEDAAEPVAETEGAEPAGVTPGVEVPAPRLSEGGAASGADSLRAQPGAEHVRARRGG